MTSTSRRWAMKADPTNVQSLVLYSTGTILGKALEPLKSGQAKVKTLIPQR